MNIKGLVRKFINGTDDDYIESEEQEYEDDFDFAPDQSPLPEPQIHPVHSRSDSSCSREKRKNHLAVVYS